MISSQNPFIQQLNRRKKTDIGLHIPTHTKKKTKHSMYPEPKKPTSNYQYPALLCCSPLQQRPSQPTQSEEAPAAEATCRPP